MGTDDKKKNMPEHAAKLRFDSEERLRAKQFKSSSLRTKEEVHRLVHELEVHQIELEMQNDELRRSQEELELSRNTYVELYDFAPVGYFTLDAAGLIREVNLTGASLLGVERGMLLEKPFINFMAGSAEKDLFSKHCKEVFRNQGKQACEIRLKSKDGATFHAMLQSIAKELVHGAPGYICTAVTDITERKKLEGALKEACNELDLRVKERTGELVSANIQLSREIEERKRTEESLKTMNVEIKGLKDRLQAENIYLHQEVARHFNFGEIIGQSNALSHVFLRIEQVAPMNATVLLLGETGTGKGVIARAIHNCGVRRERPMITVNCTTLPANLVESELFGRERGAFTGSDARQIGRFELADGGTIFLDEIGEMPLELQSKLLRVIQDGEFERLGSPRTIKTDVRIIAASNRNLEEDMRSGRFREDLFYRLNVFPITVPPLRQRKEDIPLLVNHFVAKFNKKTGKKIATVSKEIMNSLQQYHWPGNVRELESVIERAIITSPGTALQVLDRFDVFQKEKEPEGNDIKALAQLEHDHVLQVLQKTGWRIEGKNGAAILLGLNASTLRARMRKYGIFRQ